MAKSEYLQREEAAKKQLGKKGVQKRVKQLPRAARATARGLVREVTGIDVSRKGVSVSPESLAMALPLGKVLKAAKALRAAGKVEQAAALSARAGAKTRGTKIGRYSAYWDVNEEGDSFIDLAKSRRVESESMFPRSSSGTLESVPGLNQSSARSAAKSFGRAASSERGAARSLRNVPGERDRSMKLFKDSLANERAGRAIAKYKNTKGGR